MALPPILGGARLLDLETVGVVADGSDGKEAIVGAIGTPAEIKSISAVTGFGGDPPLKIVVDCALRPGSEVLELRLRLLNQSANEVALPLNGMDGDL